MEIMNLNGKEYVLKEDMEKEMTKSTNISGFQLLSKDALLMDETNVMAIGSCKVGSGYVAVTLSTEYLEKAINCIKSLSFNKKGLDKISLVWGKDSPAIIGRISDNGECSGIIIAPRVEKHRG